jgi:phosphoserine phosphatase RsbU/P
VFAELDPRGWVQLVVCGHPPPLRLTGDGELGPLAPAVFATPLGLHPDLHLSAFSVRTGDRLLFFTDGLLEARDRAGRFFRLDDHLEALCLPSLQAAVDDVLDRLRQHTRYHVDDGIAVLLVELTLTPDSGLDGQDDAPLTRTVPPDVDDQLTATVQEH